MRLICVYFLMLLIGCSGSDAKYVNKGIPDHPLDMNDSHNMGHVQRMQEKWTKFADALGMDPSYAWLSAEELNQDLLPGERQKLSEAKLIKQLSTPPSLLTDEARRGEYVERLTKAGEHFASRAHRTRCAEIVGVEFLHSAREKHSNFPEPHKARAEYFPEAGEFQILKDQEGQPVASVYKLRYRLQMSQKHSAKNVGNRPKDMKIESLVRSGLLVVPQKAQHTAPLLAYGHLGDMGLSYREIASLFGDMQQNHIIVAPSFPGEPICHGRPRPNGSCDQDGTIALPVGKVSTWDYDADELLGMHHCVYQLIADHTNRLLPRAGDKRLELEKLQSELRSAYLPQAVGPEVKGTVEFVKDWVTKVISDTLEDVLRLRPEDQNDFVELVKDIQAHQETALDSPVSAYNFVIKNPRGEKFIKELVPLFSQFMTFKSENTVGEPKQSDKGMTEAWWRITKILVRAFPAGDGLGSIANRFAILETQVFKDILTDKKLLENLLTYMGSSLSVETFLKLQDLRTHFRGKPTSIIMGSSRGGMVAGVALAKVGAALGRTGENLNQVGSGTPGEHQLSQIQDVLSEPLGEAYQGMPSQFSCAAFVSAPMSVMTGRFRVLLRMLVTGEVENTSYLHLPGVSDVKNLFKKYREDTTDDPKLLDEVVNASFRRDIPFLGPYIITALNNWSMFDWIKLLDTKGKTRFPKGALMYLHGMEDRVVPVEQSQIAYNVLLQQVHSPEVLRKTLSLGMKPQSSKAGLDLEETHGLSMTFRAFRLRAEDQSLMRMNSPFYTQHLDDIFMRSSSIIPDGFFKPQDKPMQAMIEDALVSAREAAAKAEALFNEAQKVYGVYKFGDPNNHPEVLKARGVYADAYELHNVIVKELWQKTSFDEAKVPFYARQLFDKEDQLSSPTTSAEDRLARLAVIAGTLKSIKLRLQTSKDSKGTALTYLEDEHNLTPHQVLKNWRYNACAKALEPIPHN